MHIKTRRNKRCDKRCRTRRKVLRRAHCKKLKSTPFFNKIVKEWKRKTNNGYVKMDVSKKYTCDYYLGASPEEDYWNHVHLIRNTKYPEKMAHHPGYVFKKKLNGYVTHSKVHAIDKKDDPKDVVNDILGRYKDFV